MSDLQQRLEAAVADLREAVTWQDVADILRTVGIKGRPGNCARCPIALLVSKRLGGLPVRVEMGAIHAFTSPDPDAYIAVAEQSDAVRSFIEYFDYIDVRFASAELRDLVAL